MKITNSIYPNHNLANETERGDNLGIDFIISSIFGLTAVVIYFATLEYGSHIPFKNKAIAFSIYLAVRFVYYFIFELWFSRTPGKFQTQTIVVNKDGGKPNVIQLLTRNIVRFISIISGISDDERALHDAASNTFVIQDSDLKKIELKRPWHLLINVTIGLLWMYYILKTPEKSSTETGLLITLILATIFAVIIGFRNLGKTSNQKKYR